MTTFVLWSLAVFGGITAILISVAVLAFAAGWCADRQREAERERQLAIKGLRVCDLYWLTEWPILADVAVWANEDSRMAIWEFREQLRKKYPLPAIRAAEDDAANWRLLEVGEVVEEGDEFQSKSRKVWEPVPKEVIGKPIHSVHFPHRRRRVPLPDHRDLPAAVAELRARVARLEDHFADASKMVTPKPAPPPADGLRTERVTLELTGRFDTPPSDWPWEAIFAHDVRVHLEPGDSVRVVEESETSDRCHRWDRDGERCLKCNDKDWMGGPCNTTDEEYFARLTAHRDAAIRERDAAKEECGRLRHLLKTKESECETHHPWVHPSAAPAANAGGEARQEPVAWGVMNGDGSVYEAFADHEVQKQQAIELAQQSQKLFGLSELPLSPLYAAPPEPRGWLTAEERDAVDHAADIIEDMEDDDGNPLNSKADALRGLLARETPPKVRRPNVNVVPLTAGARDRMWIAAIREAGGEVADA